MYNDDSFNDSDEMFNLYSSKKITETFKAQLQKLVHNNPTLKNGLNSNTYKEDIQSVKDNADSKTENEALHETSDNVVAESPPASRSIESLLGDSIEIVEELVPRKATRQSERLRKKKQVINYDLDSDHFDIQPHNSLNSTPASRGRKGAISTKRLKKRSIDEIILDDSPKPCESLDEDEINPEVSVKVIWKSVTVKKFQIRKFQKMSKIFEQLSKEENISENKIVLTFNNVRVNPNDTPDSLNLQVFHFIDGGVLSQLRNCSESGDSQVPESSDSLTLKFQDINKKVVKVKLCSKEKMKVGMIKCSEQLEIPLEKIKFFFDGEIIDSSQTPTSLGLENDEIIDIKISD